MATQRCIYGPRHGRQYQGERALVEQGGFTPATKDALRRWHDHLYAKGSGELRVVKLSSQARRIVRDLGVGFEAATRADVERLLAAYNRSREWTAATKADYRRCLKQFYAWYREEDPRVAAGDAEAARLYQYLGKHVTASCQPEEIDAGQVLSQEDILAVIRQGASTAKERAFLAVLHEGGFRAAELLNLQLRDVEFREDRVIVQCDGKTGRRQVPLVWSTGYLAAWLDLHPARDARDDYLWVTENQNPGLRGLPLKHGGAQKMIRRCFQKAGLRKPSNLHWFRHSRATLNARWMSEAILCRFFGWTLGSHMVRRYVHLNVGQVEDAVLTMNGVKRPEDEAPKAQVCACGLANEPTARYCHRCGKPLNLQALSEDEPKKTAAIEEAMREFARLARDPAALARVLELAQQYQKKTIGRSQPISD